jgi:hypothetical protein
MFSQKKYGEWARAGAGCSEVRSEFTTCFSRLQVSAHPPDRFQTGFGYRAGVFHYSRQNIGKADE